jgi:DNA-binding XRE family transcriptional regulator
MVDVDLIELEIGSPKEAVNFPGEIRKWKTRLFAARKKRKLTLKKAAKEFGISDVHLSRLEHGVGDVPLRLARRIANFYGYQIEYLWVPTP